MMPTKFANAAELQAHYKAVHKRIWTAPPSPHPESEPQPMRPSAPRNLPTVPLRERPAVGRLPRPTPTPEDMIVSPKTVVLTAGRAPFTPARLIESIIHACCQHFAISRVDVISQRRTARVVYARQVAMHVARLDTTKSLPEIGRRFGGRDHTTVLHGCRKIEEGAMRDPEIAADVFGVRMLAGLIEARGRGDEG
jgi:hypothetical protein